MPCIWKIENKNKLIFAIDAEYKELLVAICKDHLQCFRGVPLTYEDIYYEFLANCVAFIKAFTPELGVPFRSYLMIKCKFFAKNMCKKYTIKNHRVMNSYVPWEEGYSHVRDEQCEVPTDFCFNPRTLSKDERTFYRHYFVNNLSPKEVAAKMRISRYKCKQLELAIIRKAQSKFKI